MANCYPCKHLICTTHCLSYEPRFERPWTTTPSEESRPLRKRPSAGRTGHRIVRCPGWGRPMQSIHVNLQVVDIACPSVRPPIILKPSSFTAQLSADRILRRARRVQREAVNVDGRTRRFELQAEEGGRSDTLGGASGCAPPMASNASTANSSAAPGSPPSSQTLPHACVLCPRCLPNAISRNGGLIA